ncbi:MAG: glycosyltransferase family 2 protein [Paraprevotella sp.]|nr:glycosyltransferase family 2 protein [Paraprevotella sp.]
MISFIILNYNTHLLTLRCIESILAHPPQMPYEILVVDNHSPQEDLEALRQGIHTPDIRIIESKQNTGFGTGNMLGANFAKGEFLCFLNSDIVLPEDSVSPLCNYLTQHPEVGCITPQQYNDRQQLVPSFNHAPGIRHEVFGKKLLEHICPHRYPKRKGILYTKPFHVTQINGCFMLFPADKFRAIGGFDINIFLYYEEYDVCKRLAQKGWKSTVHPQYRFLHLHGASTSNIRSLAYRELYISKMYCYRKHHNLIKSTIYRLIHIIKLSVSPRRWHLLPIVCRGESLSRSMRHSVQ